MARILFQRAAPGTRLVRGENIRRLQAALETAGHKVGVLDGIFGGDTEAALKSWQRTGNKPADGAIAFEDWPTLTGAPVPPLRDRALQLTADFESHGFGKVVGNFDGAWLTWGIIGFTMKHGEVQRILNEVRQRHPALLTEAFGPLEVELAAALDGGPAEQEAFGNRISIGQGHYKVAPDWAGGFARLGTFPEVQEIQLRGVQRYWAIAVRDAGRFGLASELGLALCFDIAVQNGGVDFQTEENSIRRRLAQDPPTGEAEVRTLIADVVAENSRAEYIADVRNRKRTIATGAGTVHGAAYRLADWGLADVAVPEGEIG